MYHGKVGSLHGAKSFVQCVQGEKIALWPVCSHSLLLLQMWYTALCWPAFPEKLQNSHQSDWFEILKLLIFSPQKLAWLLTSFCADQVKVT